MDLVHQELCKSLKDFIKELILREILLDLITYMRTDGTQISKDAIEDFRTFINKMHGKEYLPDNPNSYIGKKAKNAQEAHEAIRPTDITKKPSDMKKYLSTDQSKLYELIWNRALSSQMTPAEFDRKSILIESLIKKLDLKLMDQQLNLKVF